MSTNPYISNGTCYISAGVEADRSFLPCGNDLFGHKPCCGVGDVCLKSNACFNYALGMTYLLGCSDPEYLDPNCPSKPGLDDYPWVGLSYCNGSSHQWVACAQHDHPTVLQKPNYCYCPSTSRTVAFTADSPIGATASLPTTLGGFISWSAGFFPTSDLGTSSMSSSRGSVDAAFTVTGTLMWSPALTTATTTTSSAPPQGTTGGFYGGGDDEEDPWESEDDSSLSDSARIGIGVGTGIAGLLLIGAGVWFFKRRSRRKSRAREVDPSEPECKEPRPDIQPEVVPYPSGQSGSGFDHWSGRDGVRDDGAMHSGEGQDAGGGWNVGEGRLGSEQVSPVSEFGSGLGYWTYQHSHVQELPG